MRRSRLLIRMTRIGALLYFSSRDQQGRAGSLGRRWIDGESIQAGPIEPEPVLDLGALGSFDDRGVTSSCIVTEGALKFLYYSGWSLGRTVPFDF